jgi:hypothetical protein
MTTIARITTWASLQTLFAADLNGEFNNFITAWNNQDSGASTMTSPKATSLTLGNGTVTVPSFNLGDTSSGLYRAALNEIDVTTVGVQRTKFDSSGNIYGTTAGVDIANINTYNSITTYSVGSLSNIITVQNNKTFTLTFPSAKIFIVQMSNGDGALVTTNFTTSTITLSANPGIIQATNTPASNQLGIFKSAAAHVVSFISGTALTTTASAMSILFFGTGPSAGTNWT